MGKTQGNYFDMEVKDEYVVSQKITREEALEGCPIEVSTALIQARKMPKIPTIQLEDDVVIYKPFYIVEVGDRIREVGHEYGTTTSRPRRVGWFDSVVMRHS